MKARLFFLPQAQFLKSQYKLNSLLGGVFFRLVKQCIREVRAFASKIKVYAPAKAPLIFIYYVRVKNFCTCLKCMLWKKKFLRKRYLFPVLPFREQ